MAKIIKPEHRRTYKKPTAKKKVGGVGTTERQKKAAAESKKYARSSGEPLKNILARRDKKKGG